ncbi:hypothetical protein NL676_032099 [Syzygium grande]|nr:hypothetical protein NL676_032099 [Syzygium grande]
MSSLPERPPRMSILPAEETVAVAVVVAVEAKETLEMEACRERTCPPGSLRHHPHRWHFAISKEGVLAADLKIA